MNILAVGCHPDDIEIACAGTLAKYAREGNNVTVCHVANGDKGHVLIMPEELKKIRTAEAECAAALIGAKEVVNIDVGDLDVNMHNQDTVEKMIDLIRRVKPDVILTHSPVDYMNDHVQVSKLVFDASFSASVPHKFTEHEAYPDIVPIYYMDTLAGVNFLPEDYVDISETIELKLEALACHESQIKWMLEHDKIDFIDFVRTCSKFRGLQCGTKYAEAFTKCVAWPRVIPRRMLP